MAEVAQRPPGADRLDEFLASVSTQLAIQPWVRSVCRLFQDVTIVPRDEAWVLRDSAGQGLPLSPKNNWKLLALTGGAPCDVGAEWEGRCLSPLGVFMQGTYRAL